jgi:uncharacterized Tic20 family protein
MNEARVGGLMASEDQTAPDEQAPGDPTPGPDGGPSSTGATTTPDPSPASDAGSASPAPGSREYQARQWAVGAHLAGLSWILSIPGLVGVLVVWLVKRDEYELVDRHGKEALNFQISLFIYGLVAAALVFTIVGILLAIPILLLTIVLGLVLPIVAAVRTNDGEDYQYPFTIRLID